MRAVLKKVLFAGLPLAGLLVITPVVFAHDSAHREIHRDLGRMHEDFHQMPHSRWEHRQFHREMKQEHHALDRELRDGWRGYGYDRYGYGGRRYSNDYPYDRYGYGGRRYYDDTYYGSSPYDRYGYGGRPFYGDPYGYGRSPPIAEAPILVRTTAAAAPMLTPTHRALALFCPPFSAPSSLAIKVGAGGATL